jgi:hypothetical protein
MRHNLSVLCGFLLLGLALVITPDAYAGERLSDALRAQASRRQATVRWQDSEYNIELASMDSIQGLMNSFADACDAINTSSGTLQGMRDLRVNNPAHYKEVRAILSSLPVILIRYERDRNLLTRYPMGVAPAERQTLIFQLDQMWMTTLLFLAVEEDRTASLWVTAQTLNLTLQHRLDRSGQLDATASHINSYYWDADRSQIAIISDEDRVRRGALILLAERAAQPLLLVDSIYWTGLPTLQHDRLRESLQRVSAWLELAYELSQSADERVEISLLGAMYGLETSRRAVDGWPDDHIRASMSEWPSRNEVALWAEDMGVRFARRGMMEIEPAEVMLESRPSARAPSINVQLGLKLMFAELTIRSVTRRLNLLESNGGYNELLRDVTSEDLVWTERAVLSAPELKWSAFVVHLRAADWRELEVTNIGGVGLNLWFGEMIRAGRSSARVREEICASMLKLGSTRVPKRYSYSYQVGAVALELGCEVPN